MPAVLNLDGFRFVVYPNDHEPAHVHVFKSGGEIKIRIKGTVSPIFTSNMKDKDAMKACALAHKHKRQLLRAWNDIHG